MPTIRRYNSNVNAIQGGAINVRRATGEDFGAAAARDLGRLGTSLTKFGAELEQRKNKRDAVDVQRALIEADTQFSAQYSKAKLDAPLGATGFAQQTTDQLATIYADVAGGFNESGLSEENALRLDTGLLRLRQRFMKDATTFEAVSTSKKLTFDLKESFETIQNKVLLDPSRYDDQLEAGDDLVTAAREAGLPAEAAQTLGTQFREQLTVNRFEGLLARAKEPEQVIALGSELEKFQDELPPSATRSLLGKIQQAEKAMEKEREVAARKATANAQKAAWIGAMTEAQAAATQENIDLVKDPVARAKMLKGLNAARDISQATALIANVDADDLPVLLNDMRAQVAKDPKSASKVNRMIGAIKRRNKALENDPASYVMAYSPRAKAAFAKYQASPDSPAAVDEYARVLEGEQLRLGVDSSDIKYLTENHVAQIGALLLDENTENDDNQVGMLRNLKEQWGERWTAVSNQLVDEKAITGHHITIAAMNQPTQAAAAVQLARAAVIPDKDMKNMLGDVKASEVKTAVRSQFSQLASTLPGNGSGSAVLSQYVDSGVKLAQLYIAQGSTKDEAAAKAYQEIAGAQFRIGGYNDNNFRIPNGVVPRDVTPEDIHSRLGGLVHTAEFLDNVEIADIPAGMTEAAALKQFKATSKDSIYFKTLGDNTGVVAIGANGAPLRNKDGTFVTLSWTEIVSTPTKIEVMKAEEQKLRMESARRNANSLIGEQ